MRSFAALAVLIGLSLAMSGCDRQSGGAAQGSANDVAAGNGVAPDEVTPDEVAGAAASAPENAGGEVFKHVVDESHKGESMPDKAFVALDGRPATLGRIARGRPLLVNLWATWCAPCVAELPALDRIAAASAASGVQVVAVSQDQEGQRVVPAFWRARKLTSLQTWLDPENTLGFHYGTGTLPTTILYDAQGREVVRIIGALDWSGAEGQALIKRIAG